MQHAQVRGGFIIMTSEERWGLRKKQKSKKIVDNTESQINTTTSPIRKTKNRLESESSKLVKNNGRRQRDRVSCRQGRTQHEKSSGTHIRNRAEEKKHLVEEMQEGSAHGFDRVVKHNVTRAYSMEQAIPGARHHRNCSDD